MKDTETKQFLLEWTIQKDGFRVATSCVGTKYEKRKKGMRMEFQTFVVKKRSFFSKKFQHSICKATKFNIEAKGFWIGTYEFLLSRENLPTKKKSNTY